MSDPAAVDDGLNGFRYQLLDSILSGIMPVVALIAGVFLLIPSSIMERGTVFFSVILCCSILLGLAVTAGLLRSGHWFMARALCVWTASFGAAAAIHFTGGAIKSVATPTMLLPPMLVLCLYDIPRYRWMTVAVMAPVALSEAITAIDPALAPNFTSTSSPFANLALVMFSCYIVLIATLGSMSVANQKMRASLARERDLQTLIARTDALTGIANRLAFDAVAKAALSELDTTRHVALIYIDLNEFKAINDRLGHAAGDVTLVAVARRLVAFFAEAKCIARLGGDEFAILIPIAADLVGLPKLIADLRASICLPVETTAGLHPVSAAIGYATTTRTGPDYEALMSAADQSMYADKMGKVHNWVDFQRREAAAS